MNFPLSTLKEKVYGTLVYFDLFDYPLTFLEMKKYFLGQPPADDELLNFLRRNEDVIQFQDGYYFLKGRLSILSERMNREEISKKYWKKVKRFLPFVLFIPFIRMVGVCNTLSFDNANPESDIDLFIVAKTGRLFFVRFLTVLLFSLLGVRRHGNKIAGRFCLSFYVDEEALNLQKIQNGPDDIYLPFWVLTMKPLYGKKTYEKFVKENLWISSYFERPLTLVHEFWNRNSLSFFAWLKELLWRRSFGDFIEKRLRNIQIKRHAKRIFRLPKEASVVVSDHMLKFHNIDRRDDIAHRFDVKLKELIAL